MMKCTTLALSRLLSACTPLAAIAQDHTIDGKPVPSV